MAGEALRRRSYDDRKTQRERVEAHMPTTSQKGHGVEGLATCYFDFHHHGGQDDHPFGQTLGEWIAFVKSVSRRMKGQTEALKRAPGLAVECMKVLQQIMAVGGTVSGLMP